MNHAEQIEQNNQEITNISHNALALNLLCVVGGGFGLYGMFEENASAVATQVHELAKITTGLSGAGLVATNIIAWFKIDSRERTNKFLEKLSC